MKRLLYITTLFLLAACSGKGGDKLSDEESRQVEESRSELAVALGAGDLKHASVMADSMALYVDDLTPDQTVQVLVAFLEIHNEAVARKEYRRDLETIRKFVDVYDIALSVNRDGVSKALREAQRHNAALNFDSLSRTFREKLTQYDAVQDGSLVNDEPEEVPADSVGADSVKTAVEDIPLELRPAT